MNVLAFEICSAKNKASDISWSIFIQYIYIYISGVASYKSYGGRTVRGKLRLARDGDRELLQKQRQPFGLYMMSTIVQKMKEYWLLENGLYYQNSVTYFLSPSSVAWSHYSKLKINYILRLNFLSPSSVAWSHCSKLKIHYILRLHFLSPSVAWSHCSKLKINYILRLNSAKRSYIWPSYFS